jgi:hypothetical protein
MPLINTQVNNWRTSQQQFIDENGDAIDLTGATGWYVVTDPEGNGYKVAVILGKAGSLTPATDAQAGWCNATFTGINVAGQWTEQMRLTLPLGSEPLNGDTDTFTVVPNLPLP